MDILRGYEADLCWHKVLFGDSEYWAAPMGDWDAVDWRDVFEKNVPEGTTFRLVPEYLANLWKKKLGGAVTITEDRDSWDYILSMDRLKDPESGTLEQFRRYRNVFQENYEYTIEEFSPDVFDELREFQTETAEDIENRISDSEAANFFENGLLFVLDSWDAIKRHKPLHSEGLQDTDGSGGTLDDCAENNTDDKSENRILGVQNKVLEHDRILERSH